MVLIVLEFLAFFLYIIREISLFLSHGNIYYFYLKFIYFLFVNKKVVGIKRNGNTSFMFEEISSSSSTRIGEEELREGSQQDIYPLTPPSTSSTRRRKGIPHRAPFGS
ncbi:hypothetical protein HanOQP8_Chr14g0512461 [Helianthus annuus]|nr:hypothetical protein HanOQP8_Chr14g0512461 [Helianthus annuus]